MAHQRFRKFNTSSVYDGGRIANDMCMTVRAGNIIFLRGQTGFDLDNKFVGKGDAAAQADQAMKNVRVLLEEAGAKMAASRSTTSSGDISKASFPAAPVSSSTALPCPRCWSRSISRPSSPPTRREDAPPCRMTACASST